MALSVTGLPKVGECAGPVRVMEVAPRIVMDSAWAPDIVPMLSLAVTLKLKMPAAAGAVPLMTPVD